MTDKEPMGMAAYLLAYTLVRRLQAKGLLGDDDAKDMLTSAIGHLGPVTLADAELKQARSILHGTLEHVQEERVADL
jgi:hypothetical protein